MDMMNLKRLDQEHYEIRFKYKDALTGKQRILKRRFHGSLEEARAERDRLKAQARDGSLDRPTQKRRTLRHYRRSFAESRRRRGRNGRKLSRATLERDGYALKDHILPDCGDWIVAEITYEDLDWLVERWLQKPKNKKGDLYATSSVNAWINTLKVYMRHACRLEGIHSPAEYLKPLPKDSVKKGCALRPEQVQQFLDRAKERYPQWYPMCVLGFMTGARFATLSALRWEDIDYDAGEIHFTHSQYHGTRRKRDKTGKRIHVPLLEPIKRILQEHRVQLVRDEHPGLSTGLVFPSPEPNSGRNGHVSANTIRFMMTNVCEELDEELADGFPRITTHDMRRTFNTNAHEQRLDQHVIQAVTGHSTKEMSYHYDHVSRERKAAGLSELARVYQLK